MGSVYRVAPATHIWGIRVTIHQKGVTDYKFGEEWKTVYLLDSGPNGGTTGTHYDVLLNQEDPGRQTSGDTTQRNQDQGKPEA